MKIIIKTQIKLMQSKYGNSLYFILLYQSLKRVFYLLGFSACGMIAWQMIGHEYLAKSVYEQLAVIISFLCILLFKKEKQYALIPYITKLTVSKIKNYILVRELFCVFNFILFPLVVPVLFFSNAIENSTITYIYLFICLWLMGLWLNLLTRVIRYFCIKYKLFFITTLGITFAYSIILVLFYRTKTIFSYSTFLDNSYYIILLLTGIILLIPRYFYVIKQELYQVYDGNHIGHETIRNFNPRLISSNIFSKMLLLKYLRCKIFGKFLIQMVSYAIAGMVFFKMFDFKIVGLAIFLNIYTFNMLPFTVYLSSNYFDGLYIKSISIKSLLLSSFYVHLVITTILFLILLIFVMMYNKPNILPLIALYFYTSGPTAIILLTNILFAQKFDLFPVQPDFTIQRTFMQKVIGIIYFISLFGCSTFIHFFSTIGCYVIILISLLTLMTYSYWIQLLYRKFMQRKYHIMENLRNS